jgi:hypothetical protein
MHRQPLAYFKQAVSVSILVHGVVLLILVGRDGLSDKSVETQQQTIQIQLHRPAQRAIQTTQTETRVLEADAVSDRGDVKRENRVKREQRVKPEQAHQIPAARNVPATKSAPVLSASVLRSEQRRLRESNEWFATGCNPAEKYSQIRQCAEDFSADQASVVARRFQSAVGQLFSQSSETVMTAYHRDMMRVEKLVFEIEMLDQMLKAGGANSETLLQQQHLLADEVLRIDHRYDSVNLLKVLGSGIKIFNNAVEAAKAAAE